MDDSVRRVLWQSIRANVKHTEAIFSCADNARKSIANRYSDRRSVQRRNARILDTPHPHNSGLQSTRQQRERIHHIRNSREG